MSILTKSCETCGYVEHLQDSDIFCPLHNVYASSGAYCPDYSKSSLLPVVGLLVAGRVIGCDELGVKYFQDPDLWSSGCWEDWEGQP